MKKHRKQCRAQPQTPDGILREQIQEAFGVILNPGKLSSSFEIPANATVVETFAETCDILDLLRFEDTHDLLGDLMIEALTLPDNDDLYSGLYDIFDFLRYHAPDQNPKEVYTDAQIAAIRAWLTRISQRSDLQISWDRAQLFPLWHLGEESSLP